MDNNLMITNLKLIYKPLIKYYGIWELSSNLDKIALCKKGKNMYEDFLERYYYAPLMVIFNDEDLVRHFKVRICSKMVNGKRGLFFSKKSFLGNIINNVDEVLNIKDKEVYQKLKKALRERKDIYRDVYKNKEDSKYFEEIFKEYELSSCRIPFEKYVYLCKKKYNKILSGYNMVMELFDKPLPIDKFIKCFETDTLFLSTCYSLLEYSKNEYELYGKLSLTIEYLEDFKGIVEGLRKRLPFYNTYIVEDKKLLTYDDVIRMYEEINLRIHS